MATSSIPTLKANLQTALQARTGLHDVKVTYGPPLPDPGREFVWLGDADGSQEWVDVAGAQRHETYQLTVMIVVSREGLDTQAADERCFDLMAELENQLRSDATVAGAVRDAYVGDFRLGEYVGVDGMHRSAELMVRVNCEQWI